MRATLNQTTFTGGELSPRALGRTDIERYSTAVKLARNCHPVVTGGMKRRDGSLYAGAAASNTAGASILVPFVQGRSLAWMLEFSNLAVKVWNADGTYSGTTLTTPYTTAMLAEIDWSQSDATLYLFHASVPINRLQRLGSGTWVIAAAPLTTYPFAEIGLLPPTTLTLSLATVGAGRTATAGSATFFASDIGRGIIYDAGIAVITGYTSATVVTVEITRAFPSVNLAVGTWTLEGSPQAFCLPSAKTPTGATVTLTAGLTRAATLTLAAKTGSAITVTASAGVFVAGDVGLKLFADVGVATVATYVGPTEITINITTDFLSLTYAEDSYALQADAWRSLDVGSMVRINTGLLRIDAITSGSIASATLLRELSSVVSAPPLAWSIEPRIWSSVHGYPRTGTVQNQRLIAAGTVKFPRTVWGSRLGEPLDFELGTADDQAFSFTIDSDDSSAITYVTAARDLVVLTESGEFSMRGGVEKPITPTNVRVVPESNHGCAQVRPVLIGKETLFVQRAGRKIRSLGFRYDFDEHKAPDITALADHMTLSGIAWMTYQQEPDLMMWATRGDGRFLTCTIDRDQQPSVVGWAAHDTQGFVECVASIPNADREQVWAIVRRTVNGATVRYVERFDGTFEPLHPSVTADGPIYGCTVDCGIVVDNPAGQTTFAVSHLEAAEVEVLADGSPMGRFTVTAGSITLPRTSKRTLIGLPFTSEVELLSPEFGTGEGSAQGNSARTGEITMRFLDTIGAKVVDAEGGEQVVPFRTFGLGVLDNAPEPFTGLMRLSKLGWQRGQLAGLKVTQDQPLPMHLLGVIRKHTVQG